MIKDLIEILESYGVYIYVHTIEKDDKQIFQVGCVNDCYTEDYNTMEDVEKLFITSHMVGAVKSYFVKSLTEEN